MWKELPGNGRKRSAYIRYLKSHKVDMKNHTRGRTTKRRWSSQMVKHFEWWLLHSGPGKSTIKPNDPRAPIINWAKCSSPNDSRFTYICDEFIHKLSALNKPPQPWPERSHDSGATKKMRQRIKTITSILAGGEEFAQQCCSDIFGFSDEQKIMKPWSKRSLTSGATQNLVKKVNKMNSYFAGGDEHVNSMIASIYPPLTVNAFTDTDFDNILGVVKRLFDLVGRPGHIHSNNEKYTKLRMQILDVLLELPSSVKKKAGYKWGENVTSWQARRSAKRRRESSPTFIQPQGRKKMVEKDPDIVSEWSGYLELDKNTSPGRRTVFDGTGIGKKKVAVRSLKRTMDDISRDFVKNRKVSGKAGCKSWCKNNVPRHIKPAIIKSFICPFCKNRILCAKIMNKMLANDRETRMMRNSVEHLNIDVNASRPLNLPDVSVDLREADDPIINDDSWKKIILPVNHEKFQMFIEDLKAYRWHKQNARHTREQDRERRKKHPLDHISAFFDFKKGIDTNVEANQTADQKRNQSILTYFNLTIEYRDNKKQDLQRIYADATSDCADHSAPASIECLKRIFKDSEIENIFNRKRVLEWRFDGCSDNINGEILNWTLLEIPKLFPNIMVIKWSPYVNREGKMISDIHFSRVDIALKNHINDGGGIFNTSDVIEAVNEQIRRDKERRKEDKLPAINWKVFNVKMDEKRPIDVKVCEVYGVQSTFGFTYFADKNELWNHFDASTDHTKGYKVDLSVAVKTKKRTNRNRTLYQKKSKTKYIRPKKLFQQIRQQNKWKKKIALSEN